jgi:hypothetical protein
MTNPTPADRNRQEERDWLRKFHERHTAFDTQFHSVIGRSEPAASGALQSLVSSIGSLERELGGYRGEAARLRGMGLPALEMELSKFLAELGQIREIVAKMLRDRGQFVADVAAINRKSAEETSAIWTQMADSRREAFRKANDAMDKYLKS